MERRNENEDSKKYLQSVKAYAIILDLEKAIGKMYLN